MYNKTKSLLLAMSLVISIMTLSGCVALVVGAAAGAGGVAYMKGILEQNFDKPVSKVHRAGLAALKSLKLKILRETIDAHRSVINGEYTDGSKVELIVEALTEHSSKLQIRVGIFGDEEKSQMILNAVKKRL